MNKRLIISCVGLATSICFASGLEAAADTERVTVSADADQAYVLSRTTDEGLREETYVFAQGQFFPGESSEESLRTIPFEQLIQPLAMGLATKNYFPIKDQEAADLLITVHWGVTAPADFDDFIEEEMVQQTQDAIANLDPNPSNRDYGQLYQLSAMQENISSGIDREVVQNARLLGYMRELAKEQEASRKRGTSGDMAKIAKELSEERYFIVLVALDNQALRTDGERKLRWITRCNVPALGNQFADAVPALIRVGSQFYGQKLDELQTEVTHLGPGNVRMAEPEVIGVEGE